MFELFLKRRFLPLFITQFFGAFNDNFLKSAILILVTYKSGFSTSSATMYTNLAMALFILPYFLFSALAGQFSDRFNKAPCCRIVKLVEIVLMALAAAALAGRQLPALLILLFLMGAQSTFFGPAKYSLLPQHLKDGELVAGNALIEGGTFLAILFGTIFGSILIAFDGGEYYAGAALVLFAVVGYLGSRGIPSAPPPAPELKISFNLFTETIDILRACRRVSRVRHCILTLSVFWMAGSLYISQLPGLCRDVLGADNYVNTFFLALFSIGVAAGALLASLILRGRISGRLAAAAMLGMGLFSLDIFFCGRLTADGEGLRTFVDFLAEPRFWRVSFDLLAISAFGGLFSVPLQALMQHAAPPDQVARVIAGNNIVNALYMAGGAAAVAAAAKIFDVGVATIFLWIAVICFLNAGYCVGKFKN